MPNAYGIMAPVRTMVFPSMFDSARMRAVSTIRSVPAIENNDGVVFFSHLQRVYHHEGFYVNFHFTTPALKHFFEVGVFKKQFTGEVIVVFVESAACNEYLYH